MANDQEEEEKGSEDASFEKLSLSRQLVSNLEKRGLLVPTRVQHQVIPKVLDARGSDLCVNAPTGSGKTLAYALPITEVDELPDNAYFQSLSKRQFTALGCLVVVPTRELAQQVREVFDLCVRKMHLKVDPFLHDLI